MKRRNNKNSMNLLNDTLMKKIFTLLSLLLISLPAYTQPYSTKILDGDSCGIKSFKAFNIPNSNYKDIYIQYGRPASSNSFVQQRYWSWARYNRSSNNWYILSHNSFLHSFPFFCYWNINSYVYTNVLDFIISPLDTSLILQIREPALCGYGLLEPKQDTRISHNSGQTSDTLEQFCNDFAGNQCFGFDIDPVNDSIMYFGYNMVPAGGFWKSTDRGHSWFVASTISGIFAPTGPIKINPYRRDDIYVSGYQVYKSTDGGLNFYNTGASEFTQIEFASNAIYAISNETGLYKSDINGNNWNLIKPGMYRSLLVSPDNNNIIFLGSDSGLYRSIDAGASWVLYNNNFFPSTRVIGITKDIGSGDTVIVSTNKAIYKVWGPEIFTLDTTSLNYFPMAVGNRWIYNVYWNGPLPGSGIVAAQIVRDTIMNAKKYYLFTGVEFLNGWLSVDSVNGNLYSWFYAPGCPKNPYEELKDSLASNFRDTFYHCEVTPTGKRVFYDSLSFRFDTVSTALRYKTKTFIDAIQIYGTTRGYAKNLGICQAVIGDPYSFTFTLKGCFINGVVYGDTTMVGIEQTSTVIPKEFSLSQNYPNPFNPSTTIEFDIPNKSFVTLSLYDITGREVESLVNELVSPGRYRVLWNAENYSSGVYFYTIKTESFQQTKRMVLVK